jgi:HAD superfamily hydrolase (TIGR01509 family)
MPRFGSFVVQPARFGYRIQTRTTQASSGQRAFGFPVRFVLPSPRHRGGIAGFMHLDIPRGNFAGYIFDLDGTLVDTMPLHYRAWNEAMQQFGLNEPLSEDLFYSLGGIPTTRVAELFGEHYRLPLEPEKVMHLKENLYLRLIPEVRTIEPVSRFARSLAPNMPRAIATGGTPEIAFPAIAAAGLGSIFSIVVTPLDVPPGRGKPAPDMFLLAAKRMGVAPEKCLVFEDAEPGIQAALAAGMQVVRVPSRVV